MEDLIKIISDEESVENQNVHEPTVILNHKIKNTEEILYTEEFDNEKIIDEEYLNYLKESNLNRFYGKNYVATDYQCLFNKKTCRYVIDIFYTSIE